MADAARSLALNGGCDLYHLPVKFAVALTLGGGPKSTTIELAIYQAIRFEFDFALAASLGLVQLLLSGGAAYALLLLGRQSDLGGGPDQKYCG